jgi:hypothetical protein
MLIGLGPDDRDCIHDRRKPSIQQDQEQAIAARELDAAAHFTPQHDQLMPERRVLRSFAFRAKPTGS